MPFESEAQRRWAHSETGVKALGGKKKVDEWEKETKGKKLPERKKTPEPKVRLRHTAAPR